MVRAVKMVQMEWCLLSQPMQAVVGDPSLARRITRGNTEKPKMKEVEVRWEVPGTGSRYVLMTAHCCETAIGRVGGSEPRNMKAFCQTTLRSRHSLKRRSNLYPGMIEVGWQ